MSVTIDKSFVDHFQADVHQAYQRMGSKLRNTVRVKNSVKGASTVFQKVGKGTATTKARHGKVPVMNAEHEAVRCDLRDYYAGDWVDALDELKTNHDEKMVLANAGAYALGRKTDDLIINALASGEELIDHNDTGLTLGKVMVAFEGMGNRDVPDDGQRYAIVGWKQWSQLLQINEFSNADYVGDDDLPWKGTQAKRWLGTLWMPHSGLPVADGIRSCFWYHRTAIGHAIGADVQSDITWHGDHAAHFVNNSMSQGAVLVDDAGVSCIRAKE
ncbi:hypothetical protein SAMN02744133_1284 [Thalassospira xiamenensis M-5 = DSM 17429]|uniref:Phage major capsid protein n=1 Tax=Thalassospira xiamenensis M-5 = DSM 17429 TaxID=1123366 RepID=A0AB72UA27_9PROT|nr:phage capsid protein [Thalassospira xiamenensis]AJD51073.1 hypothetical protein TH3_04765 [Thalassospira xiamenensis M-5 = DSM 17429]SIT33101.1 hypothetical protein SAMN02744133_1284 [Thalassospira xiamenensis M-5 = DSM 17429]